MKRCSKCESLKDSDEFAKDRSRKDGLQPHCRQCKAAYYKAAGSERVTTRVRRNRDILREAVRVYKMERGCQICAYERCASALDAHHLYNKEFDVSVQALRKNVSLDRLLKELEKCVILCCRCHRELHAGVISLESG